MTISPETLQYVASCLHEIRSAKKSLGVGFDTYPHGQMLIGYLKGVSAGTGVDLLQLVSLAAPLVDEMGIDEDWIRAN